LVSIEVDGGEFESLDVVKKSVATKKVQHLVLWDAGCRNHENYEVRAWPSAYLLGTDGRVIWEGNPARVINRKKPAERFRLLLETELELVNTKRQ